MNDSSGGMLRPHSGSFAFLHRLFDSVLIAGSLYLAVRLYSVTWNPMYSMALILAVIFFAYVAEAKHIYRSWRLSSFSREAFTVFLIWLVVMLALTLVSFLTKTSEAYSRVAVVMWFLFALTALVVQRAVIRAVLRELRKRGRNLRNLAIAGAGDLAQNMLGKAVEAKWTGLRLVGVYDDRHSERLPEVEGHAFPLVGKLSDLVQDARDGKIDYVYIALPMRAEQRILKLISALSDTTASVYVVPDTFMADLMHARWINMDGMPMVSIFESPFYGVDGWLKRSEDVVLGSLILLLIALPMLAIALGVRLTSPGPALFKQRRYGLNGKVVEVWKFRSMTVCEDGANVPQARKNDARVTRFGAFLRRTSLDELPQFLNVLQGGMSIVGPRPHAIAHNEQYRRLIHGYMLRHKVKPGITGWAQVNGWRGETDTLEKMQKRVEYDLEYVRNWSLWLDLKIVALTVVKGFTGGNAY